MIGQCVAINKYVELEAILIAELHLLIIDPELALSIGPTRRVPQRIGHSGFNSLDHIVRLEKKSCIQVHEYALLIDRTGDEGNGLHRVDRHEGRSVPIGVEGIVVERLDVHFVFGTSEEYESCYQQ